MTWNYEWMREGTAIKSLQPQVVDITSLSAENHKTVGTLDSLAVETVNQWYVDAIQRVTKSPAVPKESK